MTDASVEHYTKLGWRVFFGSVLVFAALVIAFIILPLGRAPLVIVNAQTEAVSFIVTRPDSAGVPLINARLLEWESDNPPDEVQTALWRPAQGARITYTWAPEGFSITADPNEAGVSGHLEYSDGFSEPPARYVVIAQPRRSDTSVASASLPIAGPASVGSSSQAALAPSSTDARRSFSNLLGGELQVFGYEKYKLPFQESNLFPISSFPLPIGGNVATKSFDINGDFEDMESWYGLIKWTESGFDLNATVHTSEMVLTRFGLSSDQQSVLGIGGVARAFSDPSIAPWATIFALFFGVITLTNSAWELKRRFFNQDPS